VKNYIIHKKYPGVYNECVRIIQKPKHEEEQFAKQEEEQPEKYEVEQSSLKKISKDSFKKIINNKLFNIVASLAVCVISFTPLMGTFLKRDSWFIL